MSRSNETLAVAYQQGERDALPELWAQVERLAWRRGDDHMSNGQMPGRF